ncbi:MAG: hypothetical protein L6Q38_02480 [Nitrospira sp.]|nr:hypothetical protein [Planctomycetota bacterium]MCK6498327.1 hypothetical protein [Nitrospira sp.]
MNNVVMRIVEVTDQFAPLTDKEVEVASVEVSTPPTNNAPVLFMGDDGSEVPWVPGEWHGFQRINLADLKVKGNPGDKVTVVGGTW